MNNWVTGREFLATKTHDKLRKCCNVETTYVDFIATFPQLFEYSSDDDNGEGDCFSSIFIRVDSEKDKIASAILLALSKSKAFCCDYSQISAKGDFLVAEFWYD